MSTRLSAGRVRSTIEIPIPTHRALVPATGPRASDAACRHTCVLRHPCSLDDGYATSKFTCNTRPPDQPKPFVLDLRPAAALCGILPDDSRNRGIARPAGTRDTGAQPIHACRRAGRARPGCRCRDRGVHKTTTQSRAQVERTPRRSRRQSAEDWTQLGENRAGPDRYSQRGNPTYVFAYAVVNVKIMPYVPLAACQPGPIIPPAVEPIIPLVTDCPPIAEPPIMLILVPFAP